MARLEACYFCGTAEDAPLREVTVTPRRRQDDPDAAMTLTLCASCEGKLERVLGGLFDHVESRQTDDTADAEEAADAEPAEAPPGGRVDRIDVATSRADEDAGPDRRRSFTDQPDDEAADSSEAEAADGSDEDDAEILEDEPRVRARATANTKEGLDGVSVAEYNRVMRLLQNREFPMGRDAFVDLAANAYDLGEGTVEEVLDAVIDQGALAEEGGELLRPDDRGST